MADDPRFPITAAQLVGIECETLFYGLYLATCSLVARPIFLIDEGQPDGERWRRPGEIRWLMCSFGLGLFVIATFDIAIGLLHNYNAFVKVSTPGDAQAELLRISDWINIARAVTQVLAMILGDSVLIYRCWIVYAKRWLIILPSLALYLAGLAMMIRFIQLQTDPSINQASTMATSDFKTWWIAFFAITAVQNLLTTTLLIFRIWRVDRQNEIALEQPSLGIYRPRHLRKVMIAIAESGAFYTLTVFITGITLGATRSNGSYLVADITLQSTGIVFNVILIRCSERRDKQFASYQNEHTIQFAPGTFDTVMLDQTQHSSSVVSDGSNMIVK